MLICEILLIFIIVLLGSYVIYTDLKKGVVENRAVILGILLGGVINIVYYRLFAASFFLLYLFNLSIISALSVLLYARHYWAAGDSKLLICMTVLIPGRLYDHNGLSVPGISYVIMIFLAAYVYIIFESVAAWIKKEKFYHGNRMKMKDVPSALINYAAVLCLLSLVSLLWSALFRDFYSHNQMFFSLLSILLVSLLADTRMMRNKTVLVFLAAGFMIALTVQKQSGLINLKGLLRNYAFVLAVMILRHFVSGYNYQEIPVGEVRAGMVMSYTTVMMFQGSSIKDLPMVTTEDMESRISSLQAEAICRWGKSKRGKPSIVIVRKMPFATFIVIGILLYILIRVVL